MTLARRIVRGLAGRAQSLWSDTRGNIGLMAAVIGPGVILIAVGAVDLVAVRTAHSRLQNIADAAALASAPNLSLATDGAGAKERAASFVVGAMSEWVGAPTYTGAYEVIDQGGQRAIQVVLRGHRPSFFGNLLPPGGWHFVGDATATSVGLVPLCVLITGDGNSRMLHIRESGRLKAPDCMVHSNRDILVAGGSITGQAVQAVTSASGNISPAPGTGAALIEDPFADLGLDSDRLALDLLALDRARDGCSSGAIGTPTRLTEGVLRLPAGVHCGGLDAAGTATIQLEPGEHVFVRGSLRVSENARLEGDDVVLLFDAASKFDFIDQARVRLAGRKEGPFAGIVMGSTRDNRQHFVISSDHVESLLGVVYVPSARLIVEGSADVARDSAWTVIVAESMEMRGSPSLFINANYNASTVPVPAGVGPRAGRSRLLD